MGYLPSSMSLRVVDQFGFQFPLWDTYDLKLSGLLNIITFNSLYGIQAKLVGEFVEFNSIYSFNSLYGIHLSQALILQSFLLTLSIPFMGY